MAKLAPQRNKLCCIALPYALPFLQTCHKYALNDAFCARLYILKVESVNGNELF